TPVFRRIAAPFSTRTSARPWKIRIFWRKRRKPTARFARPATRICKRSPKRLLINRRKWSMAEKITGAIKQRESLRMRHRPTRSFNCSTVQAFNAVRLLILILGLSNLGIIDRASAQTPYYAGKTIRVVVGYQAGDSHDQWARTYTRYLG